MGVRGLETFLRKQVPNGVFSVNILDEINSKKMLVGRHFEGKQLNKMHISLTVIVQISTLF